MIYPGSLHNHSEYSNSSLGFKDSINKLKDVIQYSIDLGHEVFALTDHETVSGWVKAEKFYNSIKEKYPNFKLILGDEIYLCRNGLSPDTVQKGERYYHFVLLAKDLIGAKQIYELSTRAWKRSFTSGRIKRTPTYYQDLEDIIKANPGHVIGSTACRGSALGVQLMKYKAYQEMNLINDAKQTYQEIFNWCNYLKDVFGENDFYLEFQPSHDEEQIYINKEILKISEKLNIPYIITTDSHYLKKEDFDIHAAYLNSGDGERETSKFYASTYLMNTEELESYFEYLDKNTLEKAYSNILKIKEKCENYTLKKSLRIPSLNWGKIPECTENEYKFWSEKIEWLNKFIYSDFDGDRAMVNFIIAKLRSDARLQTQRSYDELNENLKMTWVSSEVNKAHWSAYFLNLRGVIDTCWEANSIVGPGRGSGVGFYLLYILDLIQINCLWETTPTFSWRFLNPSRVSVLDIDTDIESSKRPVVLEALRKRYGEDRVANVATFGTESSKSAILTSCRGLGIDVDVAQYISSLIPADRGKIRTLSQCYYGDEEFRPVTEFHRQMDEYPQVWEVAQKIEGLVSRLGEHAGGVIFVDEPFTESTGLMRAPNGDIITQFDLHDAEDCSLIKIDLLSIEAADKMHACLDLLIKDGCIEDQGSLRKTYEKYLGVYNLERTNKKMWNMVWNHQIQSLFQMEKQSGIQGIALTHPESVDDLCVLNSVIRLMATEKGAEQPLNKYAKFKNNIQLWYDEMNKYGLTKEEQKILEPILKSSYGISESQEKFMQLVQIPECGGFDLGFADRLRKSIAKKNPAEYEKLTKEYFDSVEEKKLSKNLCNYVWNVLVATSRGYGFNASHTLAYSIVGLQEMNLACFYPVIYWNTACLIVNSGSIEDNVNDEKKKTSTDYSKLAKAIGDTQKEGIKISLADINHSEFSFIPDVKNNQILFGLKGMLNVGNDLIQTTIKNRPYLSVRDYLQKVKPNRQAMISLIKGGAFDNMMERRTCMGWYIWETCDKKKRLTLQNMPGLIRYSMLPEDTEEQVNARRIYEFNRYLKAVCKRKNDVNWYYLDERAVDFLSEMEYDYMIESNEEDPYLMNIKYWDKKYQVWMNVFRNWITENKDDILQSLNEKIFMDDWNKYATGNISAWEMEALCFYYHEHELANVNMGRYGFVDFSKLPEEPIVEKTFRRGGKDINIFKLSKICGTCIAKDKAKGTVSLLTTSGVVNVRFRKEYFSLFDKRISEKGEDGIKHTKEESWFGRGSMIVVMGIRSGDDFISKKYASVGSGHQLYKITSVYNNGRDITLTSERYRGDIEENYE